MRTKIIFISLIFLVIASCGREDIKNEKVFKIGAILPLTGKVANYGIEIKKGIELAIEEIHDDRIQFIFEDDAGDPKEGVNAASKLINFDKVTVIIGAVPSSVTLAIAPIAESNKVILFSPASSSPKITNAGNFIFRNYPSDNYEGKEVAKYAYGKGFRNFHVITINNDYGLGLKEVFSKSFLELNGEILTNQHYNEKLNDFRPLLQNTSFSINNNEGFFIVGYGDELGKIIKQARELGIKNQFFSTVNFLDGNTLLTGGTSVEGAIFTSPSFDSNSSKEEIKRFIKSFRNKYNSLPNVWSAHGYDAYYLIYEALKNAKQWTSESIKNNLLRIRNYPGVSGITSFDENGDVEKELSIMTVKNGEFINYEK